MRRDSRRKKRKDHVLDFFSPKCIFFRIGDVGFGILEIRTLRVAMVQGKRRISSFAFFFSFSSL